VNLVRSSISVASNARLYIGYVLEEVNKDETIQRKFEDVEMLGVGQTQRTKRNLTTIMLLSSTSV
jgi:hypothetical protein